MALLRNLDHYTENFHLDFYLRYFVRWPQYCIAATALDGSIIGYGNLCHSSYQLVIGKSEGEGRSWHGHVTALSVCPLYRRQGVAVALMRRLEEISTNEDCYFVDLFVRASNREAVKLYTSMGYVVYRRVLGYYTSPAEDALDMRKALPRDVERRSVIPLNAPVLPDDLDY